MSKSQFRKSLDKRQRMPNGITGYTRDLDDHTTTMWPVELKCPRNDKHKIMRSTHKYYCHECGIYWDDQ